MNEYEINEKTLAIIPYQNGETLVYEGHDCYIIEKPVSKIMDKSCKYFGSSFDGRQKGTTSLTGIRYKAPIIVSEKNNLIFFPTLSPRQKSCAWVSLNNIDRLFVNPKNEKVFILFMNKETIEFDISLNIMKNQVYRASMLDSSIRKRNLNK